MIADQRASKDGIDKLPERNVKKFISQVGCVEILRASSRLMEGARSIAEKYPSSRLGKSIRVELSGNSPLLRGILSPIIRFGGYLVGDASSAYWWGIFFTCCIAAGLH